MHKTIEDLIDKYTSDPHSLTPEEVVDQCRIVQEMIVQATPIWVSHINVEPAKVFYPVNDCFQTNLWVLETTGFKEFIHTFDL